MDFGIPRNFFLGIRGVNFHGKFRLGIPGNLWEFPTVTTLVLKPRNSQKFQVNGQQDLEFLGIPTQSTYDFT